VDHLRRYGIRPAEADLDDIRAVLHAQAQLDQMDQDTELMKLCCVQLFTAAHLRDVEAIWLAKESSFDAHCSIDVQLLCGAGLEATKAFLQASGPEDALAYLVECEAAGDFDGFSVTDRAQSYASYFLDSTP
jgi:hypothetical protein